jgi:hypothetical protein
MSLFQEAGVFSFVALALFCAGLFDVARAKARAPSWAAAIAGIALFGDGLGQRLVAAAVEKTPSIDDKVKFLAIGTAEATANLVLGGVFILLLIAIDAAAGAARKNR